MRAPVHRTGLHGLAAILLLGAGLLVAPGAAWAGKVILDIRAGNPIDKPQKASVKSFLPPRITTNDILSTDGLDLGYDVRTDLYYVHKEIELGPKQTRKFQVQLRDVWMIPDGELERYRRRAVELVGLLQGSAEFAPQAAELQAEIEKTLDAVAALQKESAIRPGTSPQAHIQAYERVLRDFTRVRQDVGQVENLVLAAGKNPGELIGEAKNAPPPKRDIDLKPDQYRVAIIRIIVRNTSPDDARKVPVFRELPTEIKADDVLDAAGLNVRTDPIKGVCAVFKDDVEVPANQSVTFNIKIRDRWNVNGPRADALALKATNLLERVGPAEQFPEIVAMLQGVLGDLGALKAEPTPKVLNERYVAFFREQARRLDAIETKINRIEAALRPMDKSSQWGFKVKAPSMRTTWMIIYIILGFLAVMSLLFFLRWYGKTSAEKLDGKQGPASP